LCVAIISEGAGELQPPAEHRVRSSEESAGAVRLHSAPGEVHWPHDDPGTQLWASGDCEAAGHQRKEGQAHICPGGATGGHHEVGRSKIAVKSLEGNNYKFSL